MAATERTTAAASPTLRTVSAVDPLETVGRASSDRSRDR
jgi:hypothetical protein